MGWTWWRALTLVVVALVFAWLGATSPLAAGPGDPCLLGERCVEDHGWTVEVEGHICAYDGCHWNDPWLTCQYDCPTSTHRVAYKADPEM